MAVSSSKPVSPRPSSTPRALRRRDGGWVGAGLSLLLWLAVAAILALICGLYGLLSDRKRLALAAVLIASLAVTLAMYLIGFAIYDYLYTPTIIAPPPGGF